MGRTVGLAELFVSILIAGISAVNAALPMLAWSRVREARFLWVVLADVALLAVGALSAASQLPGDPGGFAPVPLYGLGLLLAMALLLLVSTLWPRRM